MLVALPGGHKADRVADALAAKITTLPAALTLTLTWDQGHEMAEHVRFTDQTGVEGYFCVPRVPDTAEATRTPTACCATTCPAPSTSGP
jgi:IS30 family transposase